MGRVIKFTKSEGIGNDFILVDAINQSIDIESIPELAKTWCDRHFGIGADGLILVHSSATSDLRMQIINADGSEPEMCGDGIRCFAKFVYDQRIINKTRFTVETLAGEMGPEIIPRNPGGIDVKVDMGEPILSPKDIPIKSNQSGTLINAPIIINGNELSFTGVSMGNPHAVIFVDDVSNVPLSEWGPLCESHELFPEKTNTEFVEVVSPTFAKMRVWERGAAETLACGTGACATVVAGVLTSQLERVSTIELPGGTLDIEWQEATNRVMMTGPATTVFNGEITVK